MSPVPSSSALAWIDFAHAAIDGAAGESGGAALIDPAVATRLHELLEGWAESARNGPVLALSFDIPPDESEFLAHAFLRISDRWTSAADERGYDISPREGDEFYSALVAAVIAALEHSDDMSGLEFGEALRSAWPRVDRLEPPPEEP